jgi:hypothetical protein
MSAMINWDRPKLERFKKAYEKAIVDGARPNDTFVFDGNEFVVQYAKYLIEYLEGVLPK